MSFWQYLNFDSLLKNFEANFRLQFNNRPYFARSNLAIVSAYVPFETQNATLKSFDRKKRILKIFKEKNRQGGIITGLYSW